MKKLCQIITIVFINFSIISTSVSSEIDIYKKIDLFGEVLEKINQEYVDEINQSESMDSAINGLLQSLDPPEGGRCDRSGSIHGRLDDEEAGREIQAAHDAALGVARPRCGGLVCGDGFGATRGRGGARIVQHRPVAAPGRPV